MITEEKWDELENEARGFFKEAKPTHDWSHVERVWEVCQGIARKENVDLEVLKAAALLHDITREDEDREYGKGKDHAETGAVLAEKILTRMKFPEEKIKKVVSCIRTHRFSGNDIPELIEAKILFDADKLDVLGAIGVARTYSYAGENGQKLYSEVPKDYVYHRNHDQREGSPTIHFAAKLQKIKDRMLTSTGKEIAEERYNYTKEFFERIEKEIKGEL